MSRRARFGSVAVGSADVFCYAAQFSLNIIRAHHLWGPIWCVHFVDGSRLRWSVGGVAWPQRYGVDLTAS